jgi:hypothetical protein
MSQVLRRAWMPSLLVAWAFGWSFARYGHGLSDWVYFRAAARSVLADGVPPLPGGPLHLYAEWPKLQVGPPAVAVMLPTLAVPPSAARLTATAAMVLVGLLSLWLICSSARRMGLSPQRSTVLLTGLLLIPPWVTLSVSYMHVDDVLALGCLCLAVRLLADQHAVFPGVLLGIAAATKPWAVVFWPLLWLLPRRRRPPAVLVCVVVAAGCWAPFLIADPLTGPAISHVAAVVHGDSTLRLLHLAERWTPQWLRPVQFLMGTAIAAAVVWRGRWAAAPLAGVAVRLVTDGATYPYYGTAAVLTAAIWDLLAPRKLPLATAVAVVIEFLLPTVTPNTPMAAIRLTAGVLLLTALVRPAPDDERVSEPAAAAASGLA